MSILQISPAINWYAKYIINNEEVLYPIVCWALIKEMEGTSSWHYIVGMINEDNNRQLIFVDDTNFTGYVFLNNDI